MIVTAARSVSSRRVLIVDDDLANRQALVDLLGEEGYQADAVCDGREALWWLSGHPRQTGLVLLDLMMPIMDGATFLTAKERDVAIADVPVVVMTASGPDAFDEVARQHRVCRCIHKPVVLAALLEALTTFLWWRTGATA
jgi:CheY-like chemotaxis protein